MRIFYRVGEKTYRNPIDALTDTFTTHKEPILDLGSELNLYNWQTEPALNVAQCEDVYAKQLASSKKPLRLVYSSGTDSHSVAAAFARNHIPLCYTLVDFSVVHDTYLDGTKWLPFKINRLTELLRSYDMPSPDYEVIVVDKKKIEAQFNKENFFLNDCFYGTSLGFNLNQFGEILKYSKYSPEKYLNIFGMEKPRLYQDGIGIYWQITDTVSMYGYSHDFDCCWFYTSPEAPELIARQAWNVLNYCQSKWPNLDFNTSSTIVQTNKSYYHTWCTVLGRRTDPWLSLMSRAKKPIGPSFKFNNDPRYKHLNYYKNTSSEAWKHYVALFKKIEELTGEDVLPNITSERYYLKYNDGLRL